RTRPTPWRRCRSASTSGGTDRATLSASSASIAPPLPDHRQLPLHRRDRHAQLGRHLRVGVPFHLQHRDPPPLAAQPPQQPAPLPPPPPPRRGRPRRGPPPPPPVGPPPNPGPPAPPPPAAPLPRLVRAQAPRAVLAQPHQDAPQVVAVAQPREPPRLRPPEEPLERLRGHVLLVRRPPRRPPQPLPRQPHQPRVIAPPQLRLGLAAAVLEPFQPLAHRTRL